MAFSCFSPSPQHIPSLRRNILLRHHPPPSARLAQRTSLPMACAPDGAPDLLLEASRLAVDKYVKDGMVVGLGSGRASGLAIQHLGRRLREGALKDIVGIPTSVSSANEAAKAGIPLHDYHDSLQTAKANAVGAIVSIDFAFDDADIVEEGKLTAVIGRRKLEGGESIIQEKSIVKTASKLAFIVPEKQYARDLDGSIPVLVKSDTWMETAEEIDDLFLGDAEVWRRPTYGSAGPSGGDFPLVTREGHNILDVIFTSPIDDLGQVAESLDQIAGVVDHGVIFGLPCAVIIAAKNVVSVDNLSGDRVISNVQFGGN